MLYLKELYLQNYCGYKDAHFNFFENGAPKKWNILFGPNGTGKSNLLYAINLMSNIYKISSKSKNKTFFRRLIHQQNYDPGYQLTELSDDMKIEAVFSDLNNDYRVIANTAIEDDTCIELNELTKLYDQMRQFAFYVDADNPAQTHIFQVRADCKEQFEQFATKVYGFKTSLPELKKVEGIEAGDSIVFYTDAVIAKPNGTEVHYRAMSAGEKKVATTMRFLFNEIHGEDKAFKIVIIDNIEMHIYFLRHMDLIEQLTNCFPEQQFFVATHSSKIVSEMDKRYLYDLEEYVYGKNNDSRMQKNY